MVLLNSENGLKAIDPLIHIFLQGTLPQGFAEPFCVNKLP